MKRAIALTAALFALTAAGSAEAAKGGRVCYATESGWGVWADNKATPCSFAADMFYSLQSYQTRHIIGYQRVYFIPVRSTATHHLFRMRCVTLPKPVVSATCKDKGVSVTIARIIEAGQPSGPRFNTITGGFK